MAWVRPWQIRARNPPRRMQAISTPGMTTVRRRPRSKVTPESRISSATHSAVDAGAQSFAWIMHVRRSPEGARRNHSMSYDEGLAQRVREALETRPGLGEAFFRWPRLHAERLYLHRCGRPRTDRPGGGESIRCMPEAAACA